MLRSATMILFIFSTMLGCQEDIEATCEEGPPNAEIHAENWGEVTLFRNGTIVTGGPQCTPLAGYAWAGTMPLHLKSGDQLELIFYSRPEIMFFSDENECDDGWYTSIGTSVYFVENNGDNLVGNGGGICLRGGERAYSLTVIDYYP